MRTKLFLATLFSLMALGVAGCGTNTDHPVYPIISTIISPATPAIISITPSQYWDQNLNYYTQFKLSYYITNREPEFLGYDLYITTAVDSPDARSVTGAYLPNGTDPSFPHPNATASTDSSALITQTVQYFKPPPAPLPFNQCEVYFFKMTAFLQNNIQSPPSPTVQACANVNPTDPITGCTKGTPCNP